MEETGSRVSVPPPSVDKDEIVVSGEKEGVRQAIEQIMAVYEEKVCVVVSLTNAIEVGFDFASRHQGRGFWGSFWGL